MEVGDGYCTIESDPGVFTELIENIGVEDIEIEELYSLDMAVDYENIYGLIFLFKWEKEVENRKPVFPEGLFFAQQVINNACATQAILSILLNAKGIKLGETLQDFKEFTSDFSPEMRGEAIGNSEVIKKAHNSFSKPEPFVIERDDDDEKGEAFHFISYVPFEGAIYELDGLKQGPFKLGEYQEGGMWTETAKIFIEERIQKYSQKEIRFNLLSVVRSKLSILNEKKSSLEKSLKENENNQNIKSQLNDVNYDIENEINKRNKWKKENIRRRHNYIPALINLLQILAEKKQLTPLVEMAKKRKQERKNNENK